MLTHVDLFSGIGGFALAAQWAGFRTVIFCEIDEFCQEVLKARFGAVADTDRSRSQIYKQQDNLRQQRTPSPSSTGDRASLIPDIRDFDGTRWRGTTLLTGGFPCQPFSCAGKRRGKADDRWLWPEMLRVIKEARPTWVLGENVAGIINMELEQVCADLEGEGYEVQPIVIPACAVNAPHRRDRVWICAHDAQNSINGGNRRWRDGDTARLRWTLQTQGSDSDAPDTANAGLSRICKGQFGEQLFHAQRGGWETDWIEVATSLCRMDDGLPTWVHRHRVQRLKALGNSIVPQITYEIIRGIAEIENEKVHG